MERCPEDIAQWECGFQEAVPDAKFVKHGEMRVVPHIMLRTALGGDFLESAGWLLDQYKEAYLLRDVHAVAMYVNSGIPLRLVQWAPSGLDFFRQVVRRYTSSSHYAGSP